MSALSRFAPIVPSSELAKFPEQGVFLSGKRDDYASNLGRQKVTPEILGDALAAADQGDTVTQYEIFEKTERDPKVARLYFRRRTMVTGKTLIIAPAIEGDAKAEKASDLCKEMLLGINGQGGIENFSDGLYDLSDAIGKAFAVSQVAWEQDGGQFVPRRFISWPQVQFNLGDPSAFEKQDHDRVFINTDDDTRGKPLDEFPAGQWLLHRHKQFSQPLARAAMFRSVVWFQMFKTFGYGDLSIWLERFGIPPRQGRYEPGTPKDDQNALLKAVRDMGKDHYAIFPNNGTIEVLEMNGTKGEAPHPVMIKHCNDEISVVIMGNTMATTQGDKGARSIKESYQIEEYEQAEHDSVKLAATLRLQLCRPMVIANLGPDFPIPIVRFELDDIEDLQVVSEVDERLQGMGWPVTAGYIADKYKRPLPEGVERDEVLTPGGTATEAEAAFRALQDEKKKSLSWVMSRLSRPAAPPARSRPPKG